MDTYTRLQAIAEAIDSDGVCPHLRLNATQLVPGCGNPDAEIVFIGEAPGKKEDEQGVPFVGAAGRFLDELLASIQLDRESVFITNIVKYQPPENRDPRPDEIAAFLPYLIRQVQAINPKIVATLGRFSMNVFLPDQKIGHIHGQPQRIMLEADADGMVPGRKEVMLLPLYHPAAALYNGGKREMLFSDFSIIPQLLKSLTP